MYVATLYMYIFVLMSYLNWHSPERLPDNTYLNYSFSAGIFL